MEDDLDEDGTVIGQQLQQIWFSLLEQIQLAQRFSVDFTMLIDGTFRTNLLNMVLIVTAGITNCGLTFVSSFSFARSEAVLSFEFIFQSLKKRIFISDLTSSIPLPRVIIGDQADGLKAAVPLSLPVTTTLQFCDWHIFQNIKKRVVDRGYPIEEREKIHDLVWRFIKSKEADVEIARQELHNILRSTEISYLSDYWQPKERQFLRAHTRKLPNLGAFSNQRSESIHPVTTGTLHKSLTIEESCCRLAETTKSKGRTIALEEAEGGSKVLRTLDQQPFSVLIDSVTRYSINQITKEWEITKHEHSEGTLQPSSISCESCELILRFGLPCKHYLVLPLLEGTSIPRSLFHPRWWTNSLPIRFTDWGPSFRIFTLPLSPPRLRVRFQTPSSRNTITSLGQQALEERANLDGIAGYQWDEAAIASNQYLLSLAQGFQQRANHHMRMPDAVKTPGWKRKKDRSGHTSGSQRLLTGPEMAEEDAVRREKRELAQSRERTKEIQRRARRQENKHAKALSMADFENDEENNQRPYQSSATGISIGISVATSSSLSTIGPPRPPPPVIPYQYSRETQALLDNVRARELSSRQSDPDEDKSERERTPPLINDPAEEVIMEIERQQLVDSGGTAPPLWSEMPEFAGMTRAARPGRERSERERPEKERKRKRDRPCRGS